MDRKNITNLNKKGNHDNYYLLQLLSNNDELINSLFVDS